MHPQALGAAVTTAQVATTRGSFPQWESFHGGQHCKPAQKWQYVKVVWTAIMQTLKKFMFYQCMSRARRLFSHSSALSGKFFCAHLKSNFKAVIYEQNLETSLLSFSKPVSVQYANVVSCWSSSTQTLTKDFTEKHEASCAQQSNFENKNIFAYSGSLQ